MRLQALQEQLGIASAAVVLDVYGHLMPDRGDELADRVEVYMDTIMEAVGMPLAAPAERLNRYINKTPEEWEEQAATFPRDLTVEVQVPLAA